MAKFDIYIQPGIIRDSLLGPINELRDLASDVLQTRLQNLREKTLRHLGIDIRKTDKDTRLFIDAPWFVPRRFINRIVYDQTLKVGGRLETVDGDSRILIHTTHSATAQAT